MIPDVADSAAERLQRALYTACGVGALVFGALLVAGDSGIIAARAAFSPWFWWASVLVVLVLPASLIVIARVARARVVRGVAIASIVGFVAVQALWVPTMSVTTLAPGATPWIQGVTALPATLAGTTWRSRWVWLFPLLQGPIVTIVQLLSSDRSTVDAVLDGVGAVIFCSILTGVAQAVVSAGDEQDAAAQRARVAASQAAGSATAQRERARIDAIVHDTIMSVLLAASRPADGEVASQARSALDAVRGILAPPDHDAEELPVERVEALLRATVAATAPGARVTGQVHGDGDGSLPSLAVAAVSEAVCEALANTRRHAGEGAIVTVDCRVSANRLEVTVTDDGLGFDPTTVPSTRLGIRSSIAGRMATVPGGHSVVTSAPGNGTSVALTWERP